MKSTTFSITVIASVLAALSAMPGCAAPAAPGKDPHALVSAGALLLDVRTAEEFAQGHIEGALNIPVQELEQRMGELGEKERDIVVYCRSGNRSRQAKQLLQSAGHSSVHDLGAMSNW